MTNAEEGLLKFDLISEELVAFESRKEKSEGTDHRSHGLQSQYSPYTELDGVSSAWNVEQKGKRFLQLPIQSAIDGFVVGNDGGDSDLCIDHRLQPFQDEWCLLNSTGALFQHLAIPVIGPPSSDRTEVEYLLMSHIGPPIDSYTQTSRLTQDMSHPRHDVFHSLLCLLCQVLAG